MGYYLSYAVKLYCSGIRLCPVSSMVTSISTYFVSIFFPSTCHKSSLISHSKFSKSLIWPIRRSNAIIDLLSGLYIVLQSLWLLIIASQDVAQLPSIALYSSRLHAEIRHRLAQKVSHLWWKMAQSCIEGLLLSMLLMISEHVVRLHWRAIAKWSERLYPAFHYSISLPIFAVRKPPDWHCHPFWQWGPKR